MSARDVDAWLGMAPRRPWAERLSAPALALAFGAFVGCVSGACLAALLALGAWL